MVEGARLEIVWAGYRLEGSNPFASATFLTERIKKQDSDLAIARCESFRFRHQ